MVRFAIWKQGNIIPKKAKKLLKQRLDFPFENKIETMDCLAKMHGQKKCWTNG